MKKCPFCAEEIQDRAIKCKHCGEWLKKDVKDSYPEVVEEKPPEAQPQIKVVSPESDEEIRGKKEAGLNPEVRPWVRYWARYIDMILFFYVYVIIIAIFYPSLLKLRYSEFILTMVGFFVWIFVESILLASWGTTPGKWLLRTTVRKSLREKLNYNEALKRSITVWGAGVGLGFPLLTLVMLVKSANELTKNGITSWDKNGNFIVSHKKIGIARVIIAILLFATLPLCLAKEKIQERPRVEAPGAPAPEVWSQEDWLGRGVALEKAQDWQGLLAWCRRWTQAEPGNGMAWYGLGVAYGELGRQQEEIAAYREALRLKPDITEAWYKAGGKPFRPYRNPEK